MTFFLNIKLSLYMSQRLIVGALNYRALKSLRPIVTCSIVINPLITLNYLPVTLLQRPPSSDASKHSE